MKDAILAFARAVFWGSLAGGGPFLLLTIPVVLEADEWLLWEVVWVVTMPILIAAVVVILAATFLGLPLTAWLARRKDESSMTYAIAGLGLGVLLPPALMLALFDSGGIGVLLALPGAFAGTVTGASWGSWREEVADRRAAA